MKKIIKNVFAGSIKIKYLKYFTKKVLPFCKPVSLSEIIFILRIKNQRNNDDPVFLRRKKKIIKNQRKTGSVFLAERAYFYLTNNNFDQAVHFFDKALKKSKLPKNSSENWEKAFELLALFYLGKDCNKALSGKSVFGDQKRIDKILVSGMGWSGSGAVYDYLCEFPNIEPVKEEFYHIARGLSLKTLLPCLNERNFNEKLLEFFKFTLFSTAFPYTNDEARAILTNGFINKDAYGHYANACLSLLKELIRIKTKNVVLDPSSVKSLISCFLDAIVSIFSQEKILLLNNIIPIVNISFIRNISNYKLFYSIRDPRTSFVSQAVQMNNNINPEMFILEYKIKRKKLEEAVSDLEKNNESIFKVQFEEFVLSENYRKNVALFAGVNLSEQEEYKLFKPWESEKNVYNYKYFTNQDAIIKIEENLPEYLWNN